MLKRVKGWLVWVGAFFSDEVCECPSCRGFGRVYVRERVWNGEIGSWQFVGPTDALICPECRGTRYVRVAR